LTCDKKEEKGRRREKKAFGFGLGVEVVWQSCFVVRGSKCGIGGDGVRLIRRYLGSLHLFFGILLIDADEKVVAYP